MASLECYLAQVKTLILVIYFYQKLQILGVSILLFPWMLEAKLSYIGHSKACMFNIIIIISIIIIDQWTQFDR